MSHHHCGHHHCEICEREAEHTCPCCHDESCEHQHHHVHEDFAAQLLEIADEAWMEILKEKIKDQIRASSGKHLEKLAKLVADSNDARWKNKMSSKHSWNSFKEDVSKFFDK